MRTLIVTIALALALCSSALAVDVLEPGYTAQVYAGYSDPGKSSSMTFDNVGNLYVCQSYSDVVWRVAPGGTASQLLTTPGAASGLDWAGGTSYGDYLYITANTDLLKVTTAGVATNFASGFPAASEVAVDRTGNYGGYLYVTTGGQDHIYRVDTAGSVSMWSSWPGWTDNGGPTGIEFDTTGGYGGKMYVASYFSQADASISGLFSLDAAGSATRFAPSLVRGREIGFDATGFFFDGAMYALASETFSGSYESYDIWKVAQDGTATKFATTTADSIRSLAFGPDGAMYITEYTDAGQMVTVSRVIPEPATLWLLGIGVGLLRRRKN